MTAIYDLSEAPHYTTDIDQHQGVHDTGLTITELVTIRTDYADHGQETWADLGESDRQWWHETLADLHAAEVELASLPADHRQAASVLQGERADDDLEDAARIIRTAIEETAPDAE
jgi:hypothetical protein